MKLITYLTIGMLLLAFGTSVLATEKNFDIIVIQGSTLNTGTENNLVTITINNETSLEFQTVKVYLDLSPPFSASNKESDQFVIGNLTTNPKGAFFVIDVDSGAAYGNYKIPIIIETNRGNYYKEMEIKVIGDTPSSFYVNISLIASITKDIKMAKLYSMLKDLKTITSSKVMSQLGVSRVTAIKMLNLLVEEGFLSHEGNTKTSTYFVRKIKN